MQLLNEWVTPHILTKATITTSLGAWSVNKFLDPEDGVQFEQEDLLPTEKGHVYLFKSTDADYVQVFMPARIMDEETGALLVGLRSFNSVEPFVLQNTSYYRYLKDKSKVLKSKKCCLQHFKLNKADFGKFYSRASDLGAIIDKDEVNVELLIGSIGETIATVDLLEHRVSLLKGLEPSQVVELEAAMDELKELSSIADSAYSSRRRIVKTYDRLCSQVDAGAGKVRAELRMEELSRTFTSLDTSDFSRIERELVHKYKVNTGVESSTAIPLHIRSLKEELGQLSRFYSALKHVSVDNNTINVNIGKVVICLSPTEISVKGNITDLAPYSDGMAVTEDTSKRRRRLIVSRENTEEGDNL